MRSTPTRVDAILHHRVERARQLEFREIVLVLADADAFGVDLDQFGQRVLQAPRDGNGAAQGDVEIGQFARRHRPKPNRPRRRPPTPRSWSVSAPAVWPRVRLASLSVSRDAVPLPMAISSTLCMTAQPPSASKRLVPAPLRLVRIDHPGVDHLAGGVHHRHLDAGAKAGIEAHAWRAVRRARQAADRANCRRKP